MKFEHNGTEIELDETSGQFTAYAGGKTVRKPSLKAMKSYLDDLGKTTFKPFTALVQATYDLKENVKGTGLARVEIVGIKHNGRKGWRSRYEFQARTKSGRVIDVRECYRDCQEAIEALKSALTHAKESNKIEEHHRQVAAQLEKASAKFNLKGRNVR